MRKIFKEKEYSLLKEYVVCNSNIPNADRCCVLMTEHMDLTMCFNNDLKSVCICTYTAKEELNYLKVFDRLLDMAVKYEYSKEDIKRIEFYKEKIEPVSECCELNGNGLAELFFNCVDRYKYVW